MAALCAGQHAADPRRERAGALLVLRGRCASGVAAAAIARRGRRDRVLPLQIAVADDRRLFLDDRQRAAVAGREPAAELVYLRFRVDADGLCVLADVGARENAVRPAGEIIPLETGPQRLAYLGGCRQLLEGDTALETDTSQGRSERFPLAHDERAHRKNLTSPTARNPAGKGAKRGNPGRGLVPFLHRDYKTRIRASERSAPDRPGRRQYRPARSFPTPSGRRRAGAASPAGRRGSASRRRRPGTLVPP